MTPEQKTVLATLEGLQDEIIVELYGQKATLRTALRLDQDQLLYGNAYAVLDDDGLLKRLDPTRMVAPKKVI